MATSPHPRRNENKPTNPHYHHERNRTFSSTTTNHYKNKLAQIGIQKDLREIIERKKLEKELEQNNPSPPRDPPSEASQSSRKVRFEDEKTPIRRSKSFTSGTTKNNEYSLEETRDFVKENSPSKKFNRSFRAKRKDFIDLQNPTNIKVELQTNSGERKCILDENVSLATVKCDLRNCRNVLNHAENKEKSASIQPTLTEKNKGRNKTQSFSRSGDKSKPFNKKNKGFSERGTQNEDNSSIPANVAVNNVNE